MTAHMRKAERTRGPLPRLVPHGGINRDMIVMDGGATGCRFRRFGPPPCVVTVDRIQAIRSGGCCPCADWGALDPHQHW
jgi:hypothetical protein